MKPRQGSFVNKMKPRQDYNMFRYDLWFSIAYAKLSWIHIIKRPRPNINICWRARPSKRRSCSYSWSRKDLPPSPKLMKLLRKKKSRQWL